MFQNLFDALFRHVVNDFVQSPELWVWFDGRAQAHTQKSGDASVVLYANGVVTVCLIPLNLLLSHAQAPSEVSLCIALGNPRNDQH